MKVKTILEIRGKSVHTSRVGNESLIVRVEDIETGDSYRLYDPNMENEEFYIRGQLAEFTLDLTEYNRNWQVAVSSFKHVNE